MYFGRPLAVAAAGLMLSSCAIHPLPEDVTGVDTFHIVRQIRCETREAARQFLLRQLKRVATDHASQLGDPLAKQLVAEYEADPEKIAEFRPELFAGPTHARERNYYNIIYSAAIAYNFDLGMNEQNKLAP